MLKDFSNDAFLDSGTLGVDDFKGIAGSTDEKVEEFCDSLVEFNPSISSFLSCLREFSFLKTG